MQGIVTDEKGTKVKAAIVVLLKVKDPDDESDTEIATYAETDEEGRFMIQDLNPDDKYFIEIHVDHAKIDTKMDKPEEEAADEAEPAAEEEEPVVEQESTEEPNLEKAADEFEDEFEDEFDEELESVFHEDKLDPDDENFIIDSPDNSRTDESKSKNICVNNLYYVSDADLIYKLYQMKNHLW